VKLPCFIVSILLSTMGGIAISNYTLATYISWICIYRNIRFGDIIPFLYYTPLKKLLQSEMLPLRCKESILIYKRSIKISPFHNGRHNRFQLHPIGLKTVCLLRLIDSESDISYFIIIYVFTITANNISSVSTALFF